MTRMGNRFVGAGLALAAGLMLATNMAGAEAPDPAAILKDGAGGEDWPAFGRTYGEQHYSPLDQVNRGNVKDLGLAWYMDLPPGNSATGPLAVDGVIYFASGYSIVHAVRAEDGKLLWKHDPKVPEKAGRKLRQGWGSRGIAWWNGKIYTGTIDGRLIAIDAATGKEVWSQMTVPEDDARFISGPPRVFDGKVIIGHGGGDVGAIRGYVTTYDAETGEFLWRFHTVPGNPADGFESPAMEMAAKTWAGEWWKHGGGGTVWNSITYDAETDTIFLGVGNGAPWNHRVRSAGQGDNLFLSSIVALSGKTGEYKWHYQTNPGESWDYNASMDIELADLEIGGRTRKVLMTAPKNGFFYVIDRVTGELVSAEPFVKVTWARGIDMKTGRPIENPDARYPAGKSFVMWPGPVGAHSWLPMAYSPDTRLVYIPAIEMAAEYSSTPDFEKGWKRFPGHGVDGALFINFYVDAGPENGTSSLLAWDPVRQKAAWKAPTPGFFNGGVAATKGGLVFQGRSDGLFNAHDAETGEVLWSIDAGAPVIAPPITFSHKGVQYVTVLSGMGTSGTAFARFHPVAIDYYTQARRVLTFRLGGKEKLPSSEPFVLEPVEDPDYVPDDGNLLGLEQYARRCAVCHGVDAVAAGHAPDLRASAMILSAEGFAAVVRDGEFVPRGMPRFEELSGAELEAMRQYLRTRAAELRQEIAAREQGER